MRILRSVEAGTAHQKKAGLSALEPASGHDTGGLKAALNSRINKKASKTPRFVDSATIWAQHSALKAAAAALAIKQQRSFSRTPSALHGSFGTSIHTSDCITTHQAGDASVHVQITCTRSSTAGHPRRSLDNVACTVATDQGVSASLKTPLLLLFASSSASKKLLKFFKVIIRCRWQHQPTSTGWCCCTTWCTGLPSCVLG